MHSGAWELSTKCWWCGCEVKTQRHQTPNSAGPPGRLTQRGSRELTPGLTPALHVPWYMCVHACVWGPMQPRHGCGVCVHGTVKAAQSRDPSRSPCPALTSQLFPSLLSPSEIQEGSQKAPVGPGFHPPGGLVYHWPLHLPSSSSGHPLAREGSSDRFLSGPLWMGLS